VPKRILVVEDEERLRRFYRTALQFAGFQVEEAGDGLHALRLIDERPPDLVVLDLMLPTVSGQVVQQELGRAHTRHIPIVIVTGTTEPVEGSCVLRKPVTPEQLVDTVRSCLGSGSRAT
jgi:two-component system alkaline phosphatase synthesis response regulator PhoP